MARIKGLWAIQWSDSDGDHVLEMRMPLRNPKPSVNIVAYARDSLDRSQREVNTIGSGVYELVGDIRFEDASQTLIDMLLAGVKGKTLTVIPDADDPDRSFDCYLIEPTAAGLQAAMESDVPEYEWHQATIRLRRTNGAPFL